MLYLPLAEVAKTNFLLQDIAHCLKFCAVIAVLIWPMTPAERDVGYLVAPGSVYGWIQPCSH